MCLFWKPQLSSGPFFTTRSFWVPVIALPYAPHYCVLLALQHCLGVFWMLVTLLKILLLLNSPQFPILFYFLFILFCDHDWYTILVGWLWAFNEIIMHTKCLMWCLTQNKHSINLSSTNVTIFCFLLLLISIYLFHKIFKDVDCFVDVIIAKNDQSVTKANFWVKFKPYNKMMASHPPLLPKICLLFC